MPAAKKSTFKQDSTKAAAKLDSAAVRHQKGFKGGDSNMRKKLRKDFDTAKSSYDSVMKTRPTKKK